MTFKVKDWRDYPDQKTPITASALEDMERRLSAYVDTTAGGGSPFNNVRAYGAKGDGTTDDVNAIQAAIDDSLTTGLRVYFPSGIYIVSKQVDLRSGSWLFGNGGTSVIKLKSGRTGAVDTVAFKDPAGGANITLENLVIDGNKAGQDPSRHIVSLKIEKATNVLLRDCTITNSLIEGAYLYQCNGSKVIDCVCNNNGLPQQDASGIHLDTCERCLVDGCVTDGNGFHGVILSSTTDSVITNHFARSNGYDGARVQYNSDRNKFSHFISDSNFRGIYFTTESTLNEVAYSSFLWNETNGVAFNYSKTNMISHCHIERNQEYAFITVDPTDINLAFGNTLRGNVLGDMSLEPGSAINVISGVKMNV